MSYVLQVSDSFVEWASGAGGIAALGAVVAYVRRGYTWRHKHMEDVGKQLSKETKDRSESISLFEKNLMDRLSATEKRCDDEMEKQDKRHDSQIDTLRGEIKDLRQENKELMAKNASIDREFMHLKGKVEGIPMIAIKPMEETVLTVKHDLEISDHR